MAIVKCRECGEEVSNKAEKCPHCGVKTPHSTDYWTGVFWKSVIAFWFVYLIFSGKAAFILSEVVNLLDSGGSKAVCELSNNQLTQDVLLVNGEGDFGYRYNATVKNHGEQGEITVTAKISTSEGNFERVQKLNFGSGQSMDLTYAFPEPTINAANVQGRISCKP